MKKNNFLRTCMLSLAIVAVMAGISLPVSAAANGDCRHPSMRQVLDTTDIPMRHEPDGIECAYYVRAYVEYYHCDVCSYNGPVTTGSFEWGHSCGK